MESKILVELSYGELQWLAGVFGLASLPFDIPEKSLEVINLGRKTLVERGMVRGGSSGEWQVSHYLLLFLQWIGTSNTYIVFTKYSRQFVRFTFHVYRHEDIYLLIAPITNGFCFTLCQNVEILVSEWEYTNRINFSESRSDQTEWEVLQPVNVFRTYWRAPELAKSMADPSVLDWADGLDWVGEFSLVKEGVLYSKMVVVSDKNYAWAGVYVGGRPGECVLRKYDSQVLQSILRLS